MPPIEANTEGAAALVQHWMVAGIGALKEKLVLANLIQRDSGPDPAKPFAQLNVTVRGQLTARSKSEGVNITSDAPTNTNVPVVLQFHDYVSWSYEDTAQAMMNPTGLDYMLDALRTLGGRIEGRCAALYAGLSTQIGVAATPITEALMLEAKQELDNLRCPPDGRFAFIAGTEENELLAIDKFSRADARGQNSTLTEGAIGRLFGFDVYGSQFVAETVGPPKQVHNIMGHGSFAVMAMRPLELPRAGAAGLYIMDEATGLSFRYVWGYDIKAQATIHTVDVLYGLAVVDARKAIEVRT